MPTTGQLNAHLSGRYRIEREIGAGGMATVYLAHDLKHDRQVAIKVLHPELAVALGAERFLAEIKTTARLQHPHILPLLDSGNAGGLLYYVMPFVAGESLRDRLTREKQLPIEDAVRIAREMADALGHAHGLGVIHRDIKPENVLLQEGHALVADFGIALAVSAAGGVRMTQTGLSLGTPQYMSPEQAMGEKAIDARADIYALGAVTYEMLTGDPPFTGATVQAIVARVISEEPRPIARVRKTVPGHVEAAVLQALAKLPADRWGSAADFTRSLGNPHVTIQAESRDARRPVRLPWLPVGPRPSRASVALFALALLLAAYGAWTTRVGARSVTSTIRFPLNTSRRHLVWVTGSQPPIAVSDDGQTLVFEAGGQLFVRVLDELAPRAIDGTEGATGPAVSPDAKLVAFIRGTELMTIPIAGGAATRIANVPPGSHGISWAGSGTVLVGGSQENPSIMAVPASGGSPVMVTVVDSAAGEAEHRWPRTIGDGRTVIFSAWPRTGSVDSARLAVTDIGQQSHRILDAVGVFPLNASNGLLAWVRADGAVAVAPFDRRGATVTGQTSVVLDRVHHSNSSLARAAMSPSGTLAYIGEWTAMQLGIGPDVATQRSLFSARRLFDPVFSPDGKRIAFVLETARDTGVYLIDTVSAAIQPLTLDHPGRENTPTWSGNGSRIAYVGRDSANARGIWWRSADGSGRALLLVPADSLQVDQPTFSRDGRTLLFRRGRDIWALPMAPGAKPHPLVESQFPKSAASLSPDGRWIAYQSTQGGITQVYAENISGQRERVLISGPGGTAPRWSHDGRTLYYVERSQIVAANLQLTSGLSVLSRKVVRSSMFPVGQTAQFDIDRTGRVFVFALPGEFDGPATVVVNWIAEVSRRIHGDGEQ